MDAPALLFSAHKVISKATVDSDRMAVTAILTFPTFDLAGDYIEPEGGDYTRHKAQPWVGLEHYRLRKGTKDELVYPDHRDAGRPIVAGWARESLSDSDGYDPDRDYAVKLKAFTIKGKKYNLPVGTSYYDPDNRLSSQVFSMVKADALPGVSLELAAPEGYTPTVLKARSPLEPHRPSWHYRKWDCHAWVNCAKPVNPGALVGKSQINDALASILSRGKVENGNGDLERLHPLILKSFSQYVPVPNKSRVVVEKAMHDQSGPPMGDPTPDEPSVYDDANDEQTPQGPHTAQTAYDGAQMLVDIATHLEERLKASEHVGGKKAMMKHLEKIKALAEGMIGVGDKVTADVGKGDGATGEIDEEEDADLEDDDMEPDDEDDGEEEGDDEEEDGPPKKKKGKGALKAFRNPKRAWALKSLMRAPITRFSAEDIAAAPEVLVIPEPPAAPVYEEGNTPEDLARLEKAKRKFRKAQLLYGG